ncbi:MAG: DnaD domain protein [Bilifractor sp.]
MGLLTIRDSRLAGMTLLPDDFIDYYMPRANGDFVKIYLFLLRSVHREDANPTLSSLADIFSCTEKDVLRALRYWQQAGLLNLSYHGKGHELEKIELLPVQADLQKTQYVPEENTEDKTVPEVPQKKEAPAQISSARAREIKDNEEVQQILFFTEQYIGHPLSATDMRRILYFYDVLHFPIDLIDYLVEYCVSRGGRNMNYIEKVGLAWKDEGLLSVQAAKEYSHTWRDRYFAIFRAFGIRNRNPIPDEIKVMDKWLKDYQMPQELIREAASRTIRQTGQPSFSYADKILSDWHRSGVHSIEDIEKLDVQYRQKKAPNGSSSGFAQDHSSRNAEKSSTRFNENFHQREYDYDRLEQELLLNQQSDDPGQS